MMKREPRLRGLTRFNALFALVMTFWCVVLTLGLLCMGKVQDAIYGGCFVVFFVFVFLVEAGWRER